MYLINNTNTECNTFIKEFIVMFDVVYLILIFRPLKHQKAKVAMEKEQRRRSRQIYDSKAERWEWNVAKRHPKEVKHWGKYLLTM